MDGDAVASDERVDSLLLFPSEGTGTDERGSDLPDEWTYLTSAPSDQTTPSLDMGDGGSASQGMAGTRESISLEGHLAALTELYDLCLGIDERLARAEQALQRTEDLVADRILLDPYLRLDERLTQAEHALQSLQAAIPEVDKTVHELGASIAEGFGRIDEALRRTESLGADRTLRQLAARIDTRLADTTETVSRIERVVGHGSLREFAAALSARVTQTEETLRRIEAVIESGFTSWVDERNQRKSHEAGALRHESASAWMGMLKSIRAAQHRAAQVLAVVTKRARPSHEVTAPAWTAAMPRVDASRLVRRFAVVLILAFVIGVVAARFNPRPGLQDGGVEGRREAIASSKLALATKPAVTVPAVGASPLLSTTIQRAESESLPVTVAPPSRQAVIPDPPRNAEPDEVEPRQNAASPRFVGTLAVTSNPAGASVFVNGQRVGVTPLRLERQRAGSLALQITREGYERWSASIQVPANRVTQVTATLRPGR